MQNSSILTKKKGTTPKYIESKEPKIIELFYSFNLLPICWHEVINQ